MRPFEGFVEEHLARLVRLTGALTGDRSLAEDLVQDVLAKAHKDWTRIGSTDLPESYVRRMIINEYVSWRRRWARQIPYADIEPADVTPDVSTAVVNRADLQQRLLRLPRKQRAVVVLRYYEGLSDPEIADVLDCKPVTVRAYASRALASLRTDEPTPLDEPTDRTTHLTRIRVPERGDAL